MPFEIVPKLKLIRSFLLPKVTAKSLVRTIVCYLVYGIIVNSSMYVAFGFPFEIYTVPCWGMFFYLIRDEGLEFIQKIIKSWRGSE